MVRRPQLVPLRLVVSYAHKDERLRRELDKHLSELEADGLVELWHDHDILPGSEWDSEIEQKFTAAHLILLLLSDDFLNSAYVSAKELPYTLQRHSLGYARAIPVILRDCAWQETPLVDLQVLLREYRPLDESENVADALGDVTGRVRAIAERLKDQVFQVPYDRNPFFTGRQELLQQVRRDLTDLGRAAINQVQAISGLGGVGKTQTAVEYAYRHRFDYEHVFWVRSATEQEVTSDLVEIARDLGLPFDETKPDTALAQIQQWLEGNQGWLLVFDNADTPDLLEPHLPQSSGGHVLVTSRAQTFDVLGLASSVQTPPLSREMAIEFLLKRTGRGDDLGAAEMQAVTELAAQLDNLPLALEQAAAFVARTRATFADYHRSLKSRLIPWLEKGKVKELNYPSSVAQTWLANFEAVQQESPAAADVLRATAFLSPDEIPFELLTEGASELGNDISAALDGAEEEPAKLNELMEPLLRYSLIRVDGENKTYSTHRLVQEVTQDALGKDGSRLWAERSVRALNEVYPAAEFESWPRCRRLVQHGVLAGESIEQFRLELHQAGRLLGETASYLHDQGQYAVAEPLYQQSLAIGRRTLGDKHLDYTARLSNLALMYQATGRYAEAEPLLQWALAARGTALGEEHADFAESLNNLAGLYELMGRYAEAEPLYQRALEIHRSTRGEDHPNYATILNNLAGLYRATDRTAKAETLYRQALEIRRTALGEEHHSYAQSLSNMAGIYRATDRYVEAEPLYQRALEIDRNIFGQKHPTYATDLNNLAQLYKLTGRYVEAEPLFQQALEIGRTTLGEEHPSFAIRVNNLAGLYRAMGRQSEAEPLYRQALEIFRAALGEEHPNTKRAAKNYTRQLVELRGGEGGSTSDKT